MNGRQRGTALTIFAILFALLATSNFLKPLHVGGAQTGFVFLGTRTSGVANLILGPLFGLILAAYASGIWRMKRYALPLGYAYFAYVIINMTLFTMKNSEARNGGNPLFGLVYAAVAAGVTLAAAMILTRRRADLS